MTDEETPEVESIPADPPPRKWSWWCLWAICWALLANLSHSWVEFFGEISHACYRHALWKNAQTVDTQIVGKFREQLAEL